MSTCNIQLTKSSNSTYASLHGYSFYKALQRYGKSKNAAFLTLKKRGHLTLHINPTLINKERATLYTH